MTRFLRLLLLTLCVGSSLQADTRPALRKALLPASMTSFLTGIGYAIYLDHQDQTSANQKVLSKILIALGFVGMAADMWLNPKPQAAKPEPYTNCWPPYKPGITYPAWDGCCDDCNDCQAEVEENEKSTECDSTTDDASDNPWQEKMIYYTEPMNQWNW